MFLSLVLLALSPPSVTANPPAYHFPPGKAAGVLGSVSYRTADAPAVALPASVKGKPGAWIVVTAKASEGTGPVVWYYPDPGLDEVDISGLLGPDVAKQLKGRVLTSEKPGVYRVVAFVANKTGVISNPAVCTVTVGEPPPPVPPKPIDPPAPPPDDELTARLRALYDADAGPLKVATKAALAALYRQAAAAVKKDPPSTANDLYTMLKAAAESTVPDGLKQLRVAVGVELSKVLPTDPATQLTESQRTAAAAKFTALAAALEAIR